MPWMPNIVDNKELFKYGSAVNSGALDAPENLMVFYELGKYERDRKHTDVARELFGKAINSSGCALEIGPDAQAPRINKGNALRELGKL